MGWQDCSSAYVCSGVGGGLVAYLYPKRAAHILLMQSASEQGEWRG